MKNGIIFGKFYPLHIGHVNFIQKCKNLNNFIEFPHGRDAFIVIVHYVI